MRCWKNASKIRTVAMAMVDRMKKKIGRLSLFMTPIVTYVILKSYEPYDDGDGHANKNSLWQRQVLDNHAQSAGEKKIGQDVGHFSVSSLDVVLFRLPLVTLIDLPDFPKSPRDEIGFLFRRSRNLYDRPVAAQIASNISLCSCIGRCFTHCNGDPGFQYRPAWRFANALE